MFTLCRQELVESFLTWIWQKLDFWRFLTWDTKNTHCATCTFSRHAGFLQIWSHLFWNANKCRPLPGSSKVQVSASTFQDSRYKWADFAVIHDSTSIRAGPDIVLLKKKLEDGKSSDKVLSWKTAIKWVTWQPLSKFLCLHSVCVTWWSWNAVSALKT